MHFERTGQRGRPRKQTARQKPVVVDCTALVVVNSSRIRRRALTECQRAKTTFAKAEAELQRFEKEDKPAFLKWYRGEFGPLLEKIKSIQDEVNSLNNRMNRIERVARINRYSLRDTTRIYERSVEEFERLERQAMEKERRHQENEKRKWEETEKRYGKNILKDLRTFLEMERRMINQKLRGGHDKREITAAILDFYSEMTGLDIQILVDLVMTPDGKSMLESFGLDAGFLGDPFEPHSDGPRRETNSHPVDASPPEDNLDARLKSLWRELAFALHPDQSDSGSDPAKMELWHQVQAAMNARDVDRLEVLQAHLLILRGEMKAGTPISHVMSLTRMYRESRNALRRKIREFRKHIEWGFSTVEAARLEAMRSDLGRECRNNVLVMRKRLDALRENYEQDFKPRDKQSASKFKSYAPERDDDQMRFAFS